MSEIEFEIVPVPEVAERGRKPSLMLKALRAGHAVRVADDAGLYQRSHTTLLSRRGLRLRTTKNDDGTRTYWAVPKVAK